MDGYIDRYGNVTITFNIQGEALLAPYTGAGEERRYLPCDGDCGRLLIVAANVVSAPCAVCLRAEGEAVPA